MWTLLILFIVAVLTSCNPQPEESLRERPEKPSQSDPSTEREEAPTPEKPPAGGVLFGRVLYRGPLAEEPTMYIPEAGTLEAHTTIVDPETGGLKNAVVWVEGVTRSATEIDQKAATVDQRRWTFWPHVLTVQKGQEVRFLNSDVANHTVHSVTPGYEFNVGGPTGRTIVRRFHRATGSRPIKIECDIHLWMRGWIYVFDGEPSAVTDPKGRFRIEGLPFGVCRLHVHHADGDLERTLEIVVTEGQEEEVVIELTATANK